MANQVQPMVGSTSLLPIDIWASGIYPHLVPGYYPENCRFLWPDAFETDRAQWGEWDESCPNCGMLQRWWPQRSEAWTSRVMGQLGRWHSQPCCRYADAAASAIRHACICISLTVRCAPPSSVWSGRRLKRGRIYVKRTSSSGETWAWRTPTSKSAAATTTSSLSQTASGTQHSLHPAALAPNARGSPPPKRAWKENGSERAKRGETNARGDEHACFFHTTSNVEMWKISQSRFQVMLQYVFGNVT